MSISDNDSDWSDIAEDADEIQNVHCLFCVHCDKGVEELFSHIAREHQVDIKETIVKLHLDFYSYIKFVNYIRKNKATPSDVGKFNTERLLDDELLIPVLQDDLLLQYDIDDLIANNKTEHLSEVKSLNIKLGIAEERARLAEEFLERTIEDLGKCRKELNKLLLGGDQGNDGKVNGHSSKDSLQHEEDHHAYFSSYAHYSIHEEMLKDKVRTVSYQSFIHNNTNLFKGARVLDVGCGTSILSMFASQAGASEVIAVDNSEIAYQAIDIVRENQLGNIKIVKGRAEDLVIEGKVDVIISEWMGYLLLFESMLDTVFYCRDNYLSESGCLYPDKCNITVVGLDDSKLYESKMTYWDNVYGFKMSAMRKITIEEPLIEVVHADKVISDKCVLKEFDLMKISVSDLEFDEGFSLRMQRDGILSALVGYFDVDFVTKVENPVRFSTSPSDIPTHWKQTVFFLKEPLHVKVGDCIQGRLSCRKNKKDSRSLDITLNLNFDDTSYQQFYCMS